MKNHAFTHVGGEYTADFAEAGVGLTIDCAMLMIVGRLLWGEGRKEAESRSRGLKLALNVTCR
jgi:hypothetical protein